VTEKAEHNSPVIALDWVAFAFDALATALEASRLFIVPLSLAGISSTEKEKKML
jgi:hypothetical protein